MTKKLEEVFNLPSMESLKTPKIEEEIEDEDNEYTIEEIHQIMERADKIDNALPQVAGLDSMDADFDGYASKAIDAFDDLIDLGKNVEDKFAADIFTAASSMLGNALTAKTNKAQKKLEMIKLQLQNKKIAHEEDKLDYLKARHLKQVDNVDPQETEGHIISTRNDMLNDIIAGMKRDEDT
jgi:hypothetical protein